MKPLASLRVRLTATFVLLAGIAVIASSIAMTALLERSIWAPLDAALHEEVDTVKDALGRPDLGAVVAALAAENDLGPRKFVRVEASDGTVLATAGLAPRGSIAVGSGTPVSFATVDFKRDVLRVAREHTPGDMTIAIGVSAREQRAAMRRGSIAIWSTAALLVGFLGALAWNTTSRATGELERLAAELESIAADSLERRIEPKSLSEIDRLGTVVNRLLVRLEGAVAQLRRFTEDAAHELRTPLAALRAHLEIAVARRPAAERDRAALIDTLEHVERVVRLGEDLLTLQSVEASDAGSIADEARVDLAALAREVSDFMEPVAQEQGRCFACRVVDGVVVPGSSSLLKRLLLNLLDNAFRHTPADAAITLEVHREGDLAVVAIGDTGPGMVASDARRAFERFYRGSRAAAGSGLGLAICREIVARHRGRIELSTRPGHGTTVSVRIPLEPLAIGAERARVPA